MTKIMTPSAEVKAKTMTDGQIDKAVDNYRALLRKYAGDFGTEAVQAVLGQPEFANEQLAVFRRRVEAQSDFIVRRVKVNRSRTPQQALDATGRKQYVTRDVVNSMPKVERSDGDEVEVEVELCFFKPDLSKRRNRTISDPELDHEEFEMRCLKPAGGFSAAAASEEDPAFADEHPYATHWQDGDGNWCYAAFDRWLDERLVHVHRHDDGWDDSWWFVGVRK